jgi:uncharacterized protein YkwD
MEGMMRTTFLIAAVLCASVAVADDTAQQAAGNGSQASQSQASPQTRPLHRHPTLFGMLVRNNNIRRRVGLFPHRMNAALAAAAQDHANYMARTGQFSHYTNGGPQGRANKYGLDNAFVMWQNSGAHYASIVSRTTDAGFGYAVGTNGATYFVGIYGTGSSGETEEQIAKFLEEQKEAAKLAAEKTAAENDPNVKPASANVDAQQKPASEVKPAAAVESVTGK